jgi:ATP-dependent Clp protease, protease subunit
MEHIVEISADIDQWSLWDWWNGGNTITNQLKQAAAKAQGRDRIVLRLSSPGGDVFLGYEISNSIKTLSLTKNVVVQNTSLCASIASIIAISGATAEAYKNSLLMMHKPTVWTNGDDKALRKDAETLEKIEGQLVRSYADKIYSNKGGDYKKIEEKVKAMVEAETWLTAEEALSMGLIDAIVDDKALTMEEMDKRRKELEQRQMEQQQQAQNAQNAPKGSPVGGKPEEINAQNAQIKAKFLAKQTAAAPVETDKQNEEGILAKLKEALKPLAIFLGWGTKENPTPKKVENNAADTAAPKEKDEAEQPAPIDEKNSQTNQSSQEDMPLTTEDYKKIAIEVANLLQAQNNQQPPVNQTTTPAQNNQQPPVNQTTTPAQNNQQPPANEQPVVENSDDTKAKLKNMQDELDKLKAEKEKKAGSNPVVTTQVDKQPVDYVAEKRKKIIESLKNQLIQQGVCKK